MSVKSSTINAPTTPPADRKGLWSWALYDWANSAFFSIVLTFIFARYFSQSVVGDEVAGTEAWGNIIGLSGLAIALLAPVLGAIADRGGRQKPWLLGFTALAVLASIMLWFVEPSSDEFWEAAFWISVGVLGAEFAFIFYNAMLPDLTSSESMGRWSGWAWGLGYLGGLASLLIALFVLIDGDTTWLGLDRDELEHVRATFVLAGLWYGIFTIPLALYTPDRPATGVRLAQAVRDGLAQLRQSIRELRRYRLIMKFLIARMLYTDGLATVFTFGGVYAAGSFGMSQSEVLYFAIALNVTAGLGSFGFAWVDDAIGSRNTILVSLIGLALSLTGILVVQSATLFWVFGMILGVFIGPLQASSRAYMARIAPDHLKTQMFGLFAFSGKATAFAGPLLVGWVTALAGSQRLGISVILVFLVVGFCIMLTIPKASDAEIR